MRAVRRKAELRGAAITAMEAATTSAALGDDPLLIGLYEPGSTGEGDVIDAWIDAEAAKLAASARRRPGREYVAALERLADEALRRGVVAPAWDDVATWFAPTGADVAAALGELAAEGAAFHVVHGTVAFRHARVRDRLLTRAAASMMRRDQLPDTLLREPFFIEVLGAALAEAGMLETVLRRAGREAPLVLVASFAQAPPGPGRASAIATASSWLDDEASRGTASRSARWRAMRLLGDMGDVTDLAGVLSAFPDPSFDALAALMRTGDVEAGLALCDYLRPGMTSPWRDRQMTEARAAPGLLDALEATLRSADIGSGRRTMALRLAGFLAHPRLSGAIAASWGADSGRDERLGDYLWSAAQCRGADPDALLGDVCDAWATPGNVGRLDAPDEDVPVPWTAWAFRETGLPMGATSELAAAADRHPGLRPRIAGLLREVDRPDAARLAATLRGRLSAEAAVATAPRRGGRGDAASRFSPATRDALAALWQDARVEPHARREAFAAWDTGAAAADVGRLATIAEDDTLFDAVLAARARRRDATCVEALAAKVRDPAGSGWFAWAAGFFSPDLAMAVEAAATRAPADHPEDLARALAGFPNAEAEAVLTRLWPAKRREPAFVQAALMICTPRTLALAAEALADEVEARRLLRDVLLTFILPREGRNLLLHHRQIDALLRHRSSLILT